MRVALAGEFLRYVATMPVVWLLSAALAYGQYGSILPTQRRRTSSLGLGSMARPSFGLYSSRERLSGTASRGASAFRARPTLSSRGLSSPRGLLDAMRAARQRSNVLLGRATETQTQAPNPALVRAIQVLRAQQEQQTRQLESQTAQQVRRRPPVPHLIAITFKAPQPARNRTAANLQARLASLQQRVGQRWRNVRVTQNGGTIVLQGAVASEYDRRVIEHLVRLEPGVYAVEDRLEVKPQ